MPQVVATLAVSFSLAGAAAGRSSLYSDVNPSVGSLARLFQPAGLEMVWPTCPSGMPSFVITRSLAAEVFPAVETVAVSWLAPVEKLPVVSTGLTVATLAHSETCAVLSMLAGVTVKVMGPTQTGLFS